MFVCKMIPLVLAMGLLHSSVAAATLTIRTNITHQTIEGFGAFYGESAKTEEDEAIRDFAAYDLGVSAIRMELYPETSPDLIESIEDIRYENFNLHPRVPVLNSSDFARGIRARRDDIRFVASVWSPPKWMKDNQSVEGSRSGSILHGDDPGNRLSDDKYEHFAQWVIEYTKLLDELGSPLYALSLQNELMFTQPFQSCMYTPEEYARVVRTAGQRFASKGVTKPLFFGPEDMTQAHYDSLEAGTLRHRPYVNALMAENTRSYFDAFATHGYTDGVQGGGSQDPERYWNGIRQFGLPYWITEGGTGGHSWPTPVTNGIGAYLHHALVEGNVSMFLGWTLLTHTSADQHNFLPVSPFAPSKKTYTAMHYWRFIRPGFKRIDAEVTGSDSSGIRVSAFRDEALRRFVVVAINSNTSARDLDISVEGGMELDKLNIFRTSANENFASVGELDFSGGSGTLNLPARSIVTLVALEPVAGIELSHQHLDVPLGRTRQLVKTLSPADVTDPKVVWESSDPSVATVNGAGDVKGLREGEAVITATTRDGGLSASATVQVSFSEWAEWGVLPGGYTDTGEDFLGPVHTWKETGWIWAHRLGRWVYLPESMVSSDIAWAYFPAFMEEPENSVMTTQEDMQPSPPLVSMNDSVSNVAFGKPVTASFEEGTGFKENLVDGLLDTAWAAQTFPQWAVVDLQGVFDITEFLVYPNHQRGYQYTISVSEDGLDYTEVVDRRSNFQGATVFTNAVETRARYVRIEVVGPGSYGGPWSNIAELEVMGTQVTVPVSEVKLSRHTLLRGVGQSYPLVAVLEPFEATNREIAWATSDASVATVDNSGVVTAVGVGTAAITVTSLDNGLTASTEVTVGENIIWGWWPVSENGRVDTGSFAGPVQILEGSNWIYIYDTGRWAWLSETSLDSDGCWIPLIRGRNN